MTYAHTLKYAGAEPFNPERERDDISHEELEMLTQNETYQRLAEVRWLTNKLESELDNPDVASPEVWREVFDAVADTNAPIAAAVDQYVDEWLANYRADHEEVEV